MTKGSAISMFGDKLKKVRQQYNMTQNQIAKKLNVSRKTISAWENNRNVPDISLMRQISNIFNVPLTYFLDDQKMKHKNRDNKKFILYYLYFLQIILIFLEYLTLFNIVHTVLLTFIFIINTTIIFILRHDYYIINKTSRDTLIRTIVFFFSILINFTLAFRHLIFSLNISVNLPDYTLGIIVGKVLISILLSISIISIYDFKFLKGGDL